MVQVILKTAPASFGRSLADSSKILFFLEKHLIGDRQQVKFSLDFGKYSYLLAYELSVLFSVLFLVN